VFRVKFRGKFGENQGKPFGEQGGIEEYSILARKIQVREVIHVNLYVKI